jgi:hypothetical protein
MKLLSRLEKDKYVEIVIEDSFLFLKTVRTYRKYGEWLFQYKTPNEFIPIGYFDGRDILKMFEIID